MDPIVMAFTSKTAAIIAMALSLAACGGASNETTTAQEQATRSATQRVDCEGVVGLKCEVVTGYTKLSSYYLLDSGPMDHAAMIYGNSWSGDLPYDPEHQIVHVMLPSDIPVDAVAVTLAIKSKVVVPAGAPGYAQIDAKLARDNVWTSQNHSAHIEGWGGGDKGEYREVKYTKSTVLVRDGGFWMCLGGGVVGTGQLELGVTVQGYWR